MEPQRCRLFLANGRQKFYYYLACPLCLQNVDGSQTEFYRVLPVDPSHAELVNEKPTWEPGVAWDMITLGDFYFTKYEDYPDLDYYQRAWLLHRRCLSFATCLSPLALYLLINLVEPTFLSHLRCPSPLSEHGAFYYHCYSQKDQFLFESRTAQRAWKHLIQAMMKSLWSSWSRLCGRAGPLPSGLPREIWDVVEGYDIGRLLFILRAVSQLEKLNISSVNIPKRRFMVRKLTLKNDVIRIHFVNLGGRTYIGSLSNPPDNKKWVSSIIGSLKRVCWRATLLLQSLIGRSEGVRIQSQDYTLDGSTYFATKSDGIGIIDLAFRRTETGPNWLLNSLARPFLPEISEVRYAKVRDLTIISDSLKCRAIIPSNRTGGEPYFVNKPLPPDNCWIDSGFTVESRLTENGDPYAYIGRAKYVPLTTITNITFGFDFYPVYVQESFLKLSEDYEKYSVDFSRPPKRLKVLTCYLFRQFSFLQFEIDGSWQPPLPPETILRETIVENALGFWWAETFSNTPKHIGIVVSEKKDLKNTMIFD